MYRACTTNVNEAGTSRGRWRRGALRRVAAPQQRGAGGLRRPSQPAAQPVQADRGRRDAAQRGVHADRHPQAVHCRLTLHVQRRRRLRGRPLGVKPLAHVPAARARAAVRLGKAAGFGRGSSLDRAAAWASRGQGGRASWQRAELGWAGRAGRGGAGLGSRVVVVYQRGQQGQEQDREDGHAQAERGGWEGGRGRSLGGDEGSGDPSGSGGRADGRSRRTSRPAHPSSGRASCAGALPSGRSFVMQGSVCKVKYKVAAWRACAGEEAIPGWRLSVYWPLLLTRRPDLRPPAPRLPALAEPARCPPGRVGLEAASARFAGQGNH